jgi:hypothetical protein
MIAAFLFVFGDTLILSKLILKYLKPVHFTIGI